MAEETRAPTESARSGQLQRAAKRIMSPYEEMERLLDEFRSSSWLRPFRDRMADLALPWEGKLPKLDIVDRDEEVLVRVEVPGVKKEDLEIAVTGNLFTVKGQTRREEKEEKGDYYRCEVSQGSFVRSVALPAEVDDSRAKAQLKDGMLEVTLPKVEKAKKRAIDIE